MTRIISIVGGMQPSTPTIGTATDGGTGTTVSVAFTPSTYIGKGTITYTATSSPGGLTATGSSSPITVTGLTTGTAYTFTVTGTTNYGVSSAASAASNSVTPLSPTSFESIASLTPTSGNSVGFTNIPQTFKHLQVRATLRATGISANSLYVRINGNSSGGYYRNTQGTQASGSWNFNSVNSSEWNFANLVPGTSFTGAQVRGGLVMNLFDYSQTNYRKGGTALTTMVYGSDTLSMFRNNALHFDTLNAITSVSFLIDGGLDFTNTTISLYGIRGA